LTVVIIAKNFFTQTHVSVNFLVSAKLLLLDMVSVPLTVGA